MPTWNGRVPQSRSILGIEGKIENPAAGLKKIDAGKGGAIPWSLPDLERYRSFHKLGTTPHLCLTILAFTACRIGDAVRLGPHHEIQYGG